ncbi:hypothetical protein [Mycoplasma hafezii]|uniref:hypothetical protein n=1 Tax=Mycoplasma hafezii TaxID=525886 RepID=UPI003CEAB3DC
MNNLYTTIRVPIENSQQIVNQYYSTKLEINDDSDLKKEFHHMNLNVDIGIERILNNSKLTNLELAISKNSFYKDLKISFFINQKAIIEEKNIKQFTIISENDAEIYYDKIKRLDLHIYSQNQPNKVIAKYAIALTEFKKQKINISNIYHENIIKCPYYTRISFDKYGKSRVIDTNAIFKILWLPISSDKKSVNIAQIETFTLPKDSPIPNYNNKNIFRFLSFDIDSFMFKPFITNKLTLKTSEILQTLKNKKIFILSLLQNFKTNLNKDELIAENDNTIITGLIIPKRFLGDMQTTLFIDTNFFSASITRNFRNHINFNNTVINQKPKRIKVVEITNHKLINYRFVINLPDIEKFLKFEKWEFDWFWKGTNNLAK